jgi:hypothetical protein
VKVRYFAWVRERVGKAEEDIDPPDGGSAGQSATATPWRAVQISILRKPSATSA